MGHNGAGKTSTIRIILGLIFADRGQVIFHDHPMTIQDRRAIGYMPEANQLYRNLNAIEILKHQLKFYQKTVNQAHIEATLEQVGLARAQKKLARELSKGMARRLAWAQATIHDPEIIILDEPFSGMDPLGRIQMKAWLSDQRKRGKTMIFCTHEIDGVLQYCDHIHVIQNGRKVFSSLDEGLPASTTDAQFLEYFKGAD